MMGRANEGLQSTKAVNNPYISESCLFVPERRCAPLQRSRGGSSRANSGLPYSD
jgi:hypothetical protein